MNTPTEETNLKLKAKNLAVIAEEKASIKPALAVTAKKLTHKARQIVVTAKKNEVELVLKDHASVSPKKAVTAKKLTHIAKQIVVTAKKNEGELAVLKEEENTRRKLVVIARKLAAVAKEKEVVRLKLARAAKNLKLKAEALVITAKEKEDIRKKLEVTAEKLAATAEEKESIRGRLVVTAKNLAATAKEKEDIRLKLKTTAENLAVIAEEKEDIRIRLEATARDLATTAKDKENIRKKLEVTAEELKLKAINLSKIDKEKEDIRKKLEVTAEELALTAKKIDLANKYSRSLIEASLDPLVTISPEGKITDVNEATIKITGVPREQLTGSDFSSYFTESEKASESYQRVLKEGSVTDYPLTIKAKDGKLIDVLYNATVYKDAEGNILGVFAAARDVTEQKVLQRSRDEFFSIASHELRTPLTAIRGNTSMILDNYADKLTDPNFHEMVTDIHESSIRLIGIVNDFLDSSRLEQGKIGFKNEAFDLQELIHSVLKEYQEKSSGTVQLVYREPEKSPPPVFADEDRVRQVLINLVGNGIKFTEKGRVTMSAQSTGDMVQVMVTDTGRGIPVENQSLLFHKFQQAGSSLLTRDTTKGTGLGLYISRLMIEGMGGKIWLAGSELNKGSTFAFTIPIAHS